MRRSSLLAVLLCSVAWAADAPPVPLAARFSGPFDVSFKPFADAKTIDRAMPDELARFVREDKTWQMTFKRFELPDELPLRDTKDASGQLTAGYLALALTKLRSGDADADVMRNEIIELGDLRLGLLTATTLDHKKAILLQQVLIEVTPKLYYSLAMTSPIDGPDVSKSPAAREAVGVFKGVVDSIERVDLSEMKRDQDERLFRTRGLFAQWSRGRIMSALQPHRYLRIKRDGKDVGYVYVVEHAANAMPKAGEAPAPPPDPATANGFRIGRRIHVIDEDGKVVDTESWMYVTFDRDHERWSVVTIPRDPADKTTTGKAAWFSELGAADRSRERVFDRDVNPDTFKDFDRDQKKNNPDNTPAPFRVVERYRLNVTLRDVKNILPAVERPLPPFYLPQALAVLVPRIVPPNNPTGYLFAIYQSDMRQVMMRYVDVSPEADVTIDGQKVRAVTVSERVGFAATPTLHYLTPKGRFLGTKPADSKVELIPTDKPTLEGIWKDLDLNDPDGEK